MILNIADDKEVWVMKYKDEDSETSPWQRWTSVDRPSNIAIKAFKQRGMHRLEVVGRCSVAMVDLLKF